MDKLGELAPMTKLELIGFILRGILLEHLAMIETGPPKEPSEVAEELIPWIDEATALGWVGWKFRHNVGALRRDFRKRWKAEIA